MSARDPEVEKIEERIKRENRAAAARAAKWDREGRTDEEIRRGYEENMAAKRAATLGPVRLQLSRALGFNLQRLSIATNGLPAMNVARPSLWGNPFIVGQPSGYEFNDGGDPTPLIAALTLEQCVDFYAEICRGHLRPEHHPCGHKWLATFRRRVHGFLPSEWAQTRLRGNNLACYCAPSALCHCDPLLCFAAGKDYERQTPVCEGV